jgi:hypothetical protein
MAKGLRERATRGRPALPSEKAKRHAVGIRTTKQLKGLLQGAADSAGRSLAQEIEFRLEQSLDHERILAEQLGGPRIAALFRTLAGQAMQWDGTEGWLDDYEGFRVVRHFWDATLDAISPKMSERVAQQIEHGRAVIESLRSGERSPQHADRLRRLLGVIAQDIVLPAEVRDEFARAAADPGEIGQ